MQFKNSNIIVKNKTNISQNYFFVEINKIIFFWKIFKKIFLDTCGMMELINQNNNWKKENINKILIYIKFTNYIELIKILFWKNKV